MSKEDLIEMFAYNKFKVRILKLFIYIKMLFAATYSGGESDDSDDDGV